MGLYSVSYTFLLLYSYRLLLNIIINDLTMKTRTFILKNLVLSINRSNKFLIVNNVLNRDLLTNLTSRYSQNYPKLILQIQKHSLTLHQILKLKKLLQLLNPRKWLNSKWKRCRILCSLISITKSTNNRK